MLPNRRDVYHLWRVGRPNHIVWESLEYEGVTRQASEIPKWNSKDESLQENMHTPKWVQDGSTTVLEKLEEVNLSDDPSVQKLISISVYLTIEEKKELVTLLKEFKDIFA